MSKTPADVFGAKARLQTPIGPVAIYSLDRLAKTGAINISRLPYSMRVLLENLLRHCDDQIIRRDDVIALGKWQPQPEERNILFVPARVLLQDMAGVSCVVELAAMRSEIARLGGDPKRLTPCSPVDLVIDHSVIVDHFGTASAFRANLDKEYERNRERYALLRWAQAALQNFRVIPPGAGIIHQVNLEYLAKVVETREVDSEVVAFPDTVVGTDSHMTMINGLGVLGWGVGGIEAVAVMLGQPYHVPVPEVVGVRLVGELPEGATATDLVLAITRRLRERGVVGKFVEFFGPAVTSLTLPDRATVANMAPEYGSTCAFFPVDDESLAYLRSTGRPPELVDLVERYCKEQGLFYDGAAEMDYSDALEVDLSRIEPAVAGPSRPHQMTLLRDVHRQFREVLPTITASKAGTAGPPQAEAPESSDVWVRTDGEAFALRDGSVVIAAITGCTNTSNPTVMIGAGLLARNAVKQGLTVKPWVKTSLSPGSPVVVEYLDEAGLMPYLEALRFHVVGVGCMTCGGNSGPLPGSIARAVRENGLVAVAVLSGNRNFEARIHPLVRANYLMSPMLVVAYALAGRIDIDLMTEPLGYSPDGDPVYLRDLWPSSEEIRQASGRAMQPQMFRERYAEIFEGDERWKALPVPKGDLFVWDETSVYIQDPTYLLNGFSLTPRPLVDIKGARVLALLGDHITTDHVSPAGPVPTDSPAGRYLQELGVEPKSFNTYHTYRGNHEVMVRGTFANVRLRNELTPDREGGWTAFWGEMGRTHEGTKVMTIYDAAVRYKAQGTPLLVIAGQEYGSGSSRDWAAKGVALLGVKAVIAETFERIHRSNLVCTGVLPLQFKGGQNRKTLGLRGDEVYEIDGIAEGLYPHKEITVRVRRPNDSAFSFTVTARLDTPVDVAYYCHGGILPAVIRREADRLGAARH
jgi:aconitate hydratase